MAATLGDTNAQTSASSARADSSSTARDSAVVSAMRVHNPGTLLFTIITLNAVAFVALLVRWGYFPIAMG